MKSAIALELVADDYFESERLGRVMPFDAWLRYISRLGSDKSGTWVRPVNGKRLQPIKDYTTANGDGSRGVIGRWVLDPGIYEINHRHGWRKVRRYFLRVNYDGTTEEISREEVEQCLKSA